MDDIANALKYATRAYELNESEYYRNRVEGLKAKRDK